MWHRIAEVMKSGAIRRRLVVLGIVALAVWFVFLDSHSLLKRLQFTGERNQLRVEVQALSETNAALEEQLEQGLTNETVERVAREQYGMRRPGETVYPVEAPAE